MIRDLSKWLDRISSGKITLLALVIFLLFTAFVLPSQAAQAEESSAGAGSPDLSFYYSASELYRMAEAYGEEGRSDYICARFTFDLVWPLVYAFSMITAISWLSQRLFPAGSSWRYINLLPALGVDLDYLENVSTSIVMHRFPEVTPLLASLAGYFTALKWVTLGAAFIVLGLFAVMAVWKALSSRT